MQSEDEIDMRHTWREGSLTVASADEVPALLSVPPVTAGERGDPAPMMLVALALAALARASTAGLTGTTGVKLLASGCGGRHRNATATAAAAPEPHMHSAAADARPVAGCSC